MLILVAHGSLNQSWRRSVERVIESLQTELGQKEVRLAYMDCTPPTLMDVASEAVRMGAKGIRVLPLFLASEGHVERDIQPLVDEVREAYRAVEVELLPPVGQHPAFREALRTIATRR